MKKQARPQTLSHVGTKDNVVRTITLDGPKERLEKYPTMPAIYELVAQSLRACGMEVNPAVMRDFAAALFAEADYHAHQVGGKRRSRYH